MNLSPDDLVVTNFENDIRAETSGTNAKERTVQRTKPESMPSVYTNSIEIKMSVLDVLFVLLDVQEATEDLLKIEELIRIHMSPQLAKILAGLLMTKVAEYERDYGPIPGPKEAPTSAT